MKIPLRGKDGAPVAYTIIDDDDAWVAKWKWCLSTTGYARRGTRGKNRKFRNVRLHRLITSAPRGMDVDHINGDKLDNRKCNLRIVTRSQNLTNRRGAMPRSKSGIRGVSWDKVRGQWIAGVKLHGKTVFRKRFKTIGQAVIAVTEARKRFGFLEGAAQ